LGPEGLGIWPLVVVRSPAKRRVDSSFGKIVRHGSFLVLMATNGFYDDEPTNGLALIRGAGKHTAAVRVNAMT
jgi:hypothetical protein